MSWLDILAIALFAALLIFTTSLSENEKTGEQKSKSNELPSQTMTSDASEDMLHQFRLTAHFPVWNETYFAGAKTPLWQESVYPAPQYRRRLDLHLSFFYYSSGGKKERIVTVQGMEDWNDEDPLIHGYCHLRKANRSFRVADMRQVRDVETDEYIDDLGAYLREKYENSRFWQVDQIIDEKQHATAAIRYIAEISGIVGCEGARLLEKFLLSITNLEEFEAKEFLRRSRSIDPNRFYQILVDGMKLSSSFASDVRWGIKLLKNAYPGCSEMPDLLEIKIETLTNLMNPRGIGDFDV